MLPLRAEGCGELLSCLLALWQLDCGLLGEAIEGSLVEFLVPLLARGELACGAHYLMLLPWDMWAAEVACTVLVVDWRKPYHAMRRHACMLVLLPRLCECIMQELVCAAGHAAVATRTICA